AACSPQAWAAGAPFLLVQSLLGLTFDASGPRVRLSRPSLPNSIGEITLRNLTLGGGRADFTVRRHGRTCSVHMLRSTGGLDVVVEDSGSSAAAEP
ncbi:MAG: amylo-alpha-1,6-glucosidase, partial [Hyphomicrobiaceae bacterium]|nr:amylo-alpha-1,6-glucosidase [Hyphomicrobiaceae bacterium]